MLGKPLWKVAQYITIQPDSHWMYVLSVAEYRKKLSHKVLSKVTQFFSIHTWIRDNHPSPNGICLSIFMAAWSCLWEVNLCKKMQSTDGVEATWSAKWTEWAAGNKQSLGITHRNLHAYLTLTLMGKTQTLFYLEQTDWNKAQINSDLILNKYV